MASVSRSVSSQGRSLKPADPSTIQDKFMVGYQGWFTCAGDGPPLDPGHHGWLHWFNYPIPDGGRPNTDLWPDLSEYSPSELYPAPGVKYATGEQAFLFSSRHPKTVQRHFHWMAEHGVDGAFLQRFAGQTDLEAGNEAIRNQRDEVGDRVREAAEKEGRVFAIMYDVSGVAPERIQRVIEHDWMHLIHDKGILDSPNYLRERGKAVVTFWGFGFADSRHDPAAVRAITRFVRNNTPGGAYIMAGTPAHWRTSVSDADTNPEFVKVWLEEFDAISPWTIGRYHNEETADRFEKEKIKGDIDLINERNRLWEQNRTGVRKVDYIPVVFPGGSGHNLSEGKWGWNDAPRQGGRFMWRQLVNVRRHGVRTIYGAMWDEYDEGTAYLPVVSHKSQLPTLETHKFMALDEDGYDLPSDWYMRICGFAGESLRGERMMHDSFPVKELQDYWSTRPKYENDKGDGPSGSEGGKWQSYAEFQDKLPGSNIADEVPPPPYSLEAEDSAISPSTASFSSNAGRGPPLPPPSTRPHSKSTSSSEASSSSSSSSVSVPPPVNRGSRPTTGGPSAASHEFRPSMSQIDSLADTFDRQSTISESKYGALPAQVTGPPRISPAHSPHPDYRPEWSSSSGSTPQSWSQYPRPSSEWAAYSGPSPHAPNSYSAGYAPVYAPISPPPPLPPRSSVSCPSASQPHNSQHGVGYPAPGSSTPPSSYYGHGSAPMPPSPHAPQHHPFPSQEHPVHFPQAYPQLPQDNSFGDSYQPQGSFSHGGPSPSSMSPYASYYPRPPGPPPRPIEFPTPGTGPVYGGPYPNGPPPPPPPRPGSYPYMSGPQPPIRQSTSSNTVGDLLHQGEAQLQNLTHAGSNLWKKHMR